MKAVRRLRLEPLEQRLLLSAVLAEQALLAASTFMAANGQLSDSDGSVAALAVQPLQNDAGKDLAYVVQRDAGGYVVVAGDDTISPIVAYSWSGSLLGQSAQDNPLLDMIEADMTGRLQAGATAQAGSAWDAYLDQAPALLSALSAVESPWGPWLIFPTFSQDAPYNNYVPLDLASGERDPVGCVATSMAQIAYYWNYPDSLSFGPADAYTTDTEGIHVPTDSSEYGFATFDTLNAELASIDYDFSKDELAYLSLGAGIKAQMDYVIDGSGAYMSADLYLAGLGFGSAAWSTDWASVEGEVVQNVKDGWPAQLQISGYYGVHSAVVDGYSDDGAFHVNLGWGGAGDAWYFLPSIVPSDPYLSPFSYIDGVIYDITPYSTWASVSDPTTSEGNGSKDLNFTVTLSAASTQTVTVDYATADGTATAGSDYGPLAGTLTFKPGQLSKTVSVPVIGDTTPELDETVYLRLSGGKNATIAGGEGTGTIKNDDGTPAAMLWPDAPYYAPPDRVLYTNQNGDLSIGGYSISAEGELDGFGLYFNSAGPVTIATTGSTYTAMGLYEGAGAPALTDGVGGPGTNASISTTAAAGQEYGVLVRGYQVSTTGSYGLTVDGPAPTVAPIAVSSDTNSGGATGSVDGEHDYAFYSFTATEGGTWTIYLDPAGDFHPTMMVYDSAGTPVRGNFTAPIDAGVAGAADTYSGDLSAGETYYVRVDGYGAETGDFALSVHGPWPDRPAGAASSTTVYTNQDGDATVPGNAIAAAGQFDVFHVAFGGAGAATFQTTGSTDTLMAYYRYTGAPSLTDDDSGPGANALVSASVPAGRDLELLVGGYGASTGGYGLSVDGPSAAVNTVSIAPGYNSGSAGGSIGSAAECDFYSFTAPEAGSWTVTVTPAGGFHLTMSVYDAAGQPIGGTFTDPIDAGLAGAEVAWTGDLDEGQAVYVRVDGLGPATGTYGVAVQGPANNVPTLTSISPLTGGVEDTAYSVGYDALLAASDLADADADQTLSFRVAAVTGGMLTKGGSAVVPGVTLLGPGESLVWHPAANANGTLDAFTVTGWDGQYASAPPVQVRVEVAPVNDRPTAAAQSVGAVIGTPLPITLGGSDVETPAGGLACAIDAGPLHGTLSLVGHVATYTPAAGYIGPDAFTFTVTDAGGLISAPAAVSISVLPPQVGPVWQSGSARVWAFDTSGPLDIDPAGILVKFGKDGAVASIALTGTQPMDGLGLVISGASSVGSIKDGRKGALADLAFIVSDAPVKSVKLKSGVSGYDLNGVAIGGLALPQDIDGDGDTADLTAFYSAGALGKFSFGKDLVGDVWIGGVDPKKGLAFGAFQSKSGGFHGDFTALGGGGKFALGGNFGSALDVRGSLKAFQLKGGDFAGRLGVSGDLAKLSVTGGKSGGGTFMAGAEVTVGGLLKSAKVSACQTDNGGVDFGIYAGQLGKLSLGNWRLTPLDLPLLQGDLCVELLV